MTMEGSVTANIIEIYTEATRGGGGGKWQREAFFFNRSGLITYELRGNTDF